MKLKLHYAIIVIILQSSLSIASINNLQANELEFEIEEIEEDLNQSNPETSDSLEGFNRFMYGFYKGIYDYGFKYVVVGYDSLPNFFKDRFGSFSRNIVEPYNIFNHIIQGRPESAIGSTMRFVFNSTFGLFGFIDIMEPAGIEYRKNDFGATLHKYGVPGGDYLILFGPRNVRDNFGIFVELVLGIYFFPDMPRVSSYINIEKYNFDFTINWATNSGTGISILEFGVLYKNNQEILNNTFDQYVAIREAVTSAREEELKTIGSWE